MQIRRWNESKLDTSMAADLAEACEIHPFLSLLLTAYGYDTPEAVYSFLIGQEEEVDPFSFTDMEKAVERIRRAIDEKQRILVYGDYDVDGITATVLLYTYLQQQGADVLYRIPSREEGYGLHADSIEWAADHQVDLIITVDTGVAAIDEVCLANSSGIDVVVTDHHQPGDRLPEAVAVIDPHRIDCESTYKEFAGVGVAFMLVCAMESDSETAFSRFGDLLALGTLADMMPLQGFNRDLMRRCLQLLDASTRPGLIALRRVAGMEEKALSVATVSYCYAPRLNAAGRMADPNTAVQLLLSSNEAESMQLAQEIQQLNQQRQQATNAILLQVERQLESHPEWLYDRVLVVCGEDWHSGLLGLVAARLLDRYGKPTIALTLGEDGVAHGSCRSLDGFSIYDALSSCEDLLTQFGGHELAAGVTLPVSSVGAFRHQINAFAATAHTIMPVASLDIAVRLRPDQINVEKLDLLQVLEPFGCGNPAPLFGLNRMQLDNIMAVGNGKHLRLSLSRDGVRVNAIMFQITPEEFPVACGSTVNCVISLERNEYRGNTTVNVRVRDISFADTDRDQLQQELSTFESVLRREYRPAPEYALLSREKLAHFYNLLRASKDWNGTVEQLRHALGKDAPSYFQLLIALEIWQQAGILRWYDRGERISVELLPTEGKADLTTTPLWNYIMKGDVMHV